MTKASIEELHKVLENCQLETHNTDYNDKINAEIDTGMADLVKTINRESEMQTKMCCSGILEDHYDVKELEDKLSPREFARLWKDTEHTYLPRKPVVHFEPHFHSIKNTEEAQYNIGNNTIQRDVQYHNFKDILKHRLTIRNPHYEAQLNTDVEYIHDLVGYHSFGTHDCGSIRVQLELHPTKWEKHDLSFTEINQQMHAAIALLNKFFRNYEEEMQTDEPNIYYYNTETQEFKVE